MFFDQGLAPLRAQYGPTVDKFKVLAEGTNVRTLSKASKSPLSHLHLQFAALYLLAI